MPETLTIAVCICNEVTLSDFIPPMDILGILNAADVPALSAVLGEVPYRLKIDYLAPTMGPVVSLTPSLITVNPTGTYADAIAKKTQYDIIWVPAGPILDVVAKKDVTPQEEVDFIQQQAPGAKYVLSVCGGASILARAGVLRGRRATTNKAFFREIKAVHRDEDITWVASARWVVDGKFWTSSGVSAGSDMAFSFLEHLVGGKITQIIRGLAEVSSVEGSENDPFAAFHGLV